MQNFKFLKNGNKSGTIVFIHGNSSSLESFKPIFEDDSIPYNLLAFDLFGCGNSPHSDKIEDYQFRSFYKQTLDILEQINGPILLVGHSLGGHIAIEIATKVKDLAGILIFGAPPIKIPLNFGEAFNPNEYMSVYYMDYPSDDLIYKLFISNLFNKDPLPFLVKDYKRTDPKFRLAIAGAIQNPEDLSDEVEVLTNLSCHKYIILTNDPNINSSYLLKENDKMNCKIYDIPLSGHYPTLEAPQQFNAILKVIADEVFDGIMN